LGQGRTGGGGANPSKNNGERTTIKHHVYILPILVIVPAYFGKPETFLAGTVRVFVVSSAEKLD
jgi:hypothetical protein